MTSAPTPGGPSWQHEPAAPTTAEPPASSSFFRWIRGLDITRTPDRWVGGVSGGIARRTGLDLALVRGLIVILSVFGGIGVLLYGLAWALLPEPDGRIHVEQAGRGTWTSGLTGAAALVALGLLRPNIPLLGDGGSGGLLWTLFWIGAVVLFVYWIVNRSTGGRGRPGGATGGPGPQGFGGPQGYGPAPFGPAPYAPGPAGPSGPSGPVTPGSPGSPSASTGPAATPGSADDEGTLHADGAAGDDGPTTRPHDSDRTVPLPYQPDTLTRPFAGTFTLPSESDPTGRQATGPYAPFPSPYSSDPASRAPFSAPRTVRTRPSHPSGSATALLIGGALVVAAVLLTADYLGVLDLANAVVVACAAGAVVLALGIIVLGLRGRTSGLIGSTATLALIGGLIASFSMVGGTWIVVQDSRTTPGTLRAATDGYSVLAAQSTIDLGDVPRPAQDVVVPVNALVSEVTVIVPDDIPVEVRARMALGAADARGTAVDDAGASPEFRGDGGVLQLSNRDLNPEASGPSIVLDVRGALSDITIVTAAASGSLSPDTSTPTHTGGTP